MFSIFIFIVVLTRFLAEFKDHLFSSRPNRIELLESESHGIHQLVAGGARGIGGVLRHAVAIGLGLGLRHRWQIRVHARWRIRHMLAEELFPYEEAPRRGR